MFKRLLGPWRFILVGLLGLLTQISTMIVASATDGTWVSGVGVIATIAIILWLEDVDGDRNTRKKNKAYIIATMTSIFLACVLVSGQEVSMALMIQLMLEFAFMVAMLMELKYVP